MKIALLCSDPNHPVMPWLRRWQAEMAPPHAVSLHHRVADLAQGDILFLISCTEIVGAETRARFAHTVVLHASDLPEGRGWSPMIWAILDGRTEITLSALEAADRVDAGPIWAKRRFAVPDHALHDEINAALFAAECALMSEVVEQVAAGASPVPQPDTDPTYYPRRGPADSELDPDATIAAQFDRMRVADPDRYPAFVRLRGHRYKITLEKLGQDDADAED